jgi:hypothetical protein
MENFENIKLLKSSFAFASDTIDFCEELVTKNKKPIAEKILKTTLSSICSLQNAFQAEMKSSYKSNMFDAYNHLKNAIYWLEQCNKSGYLFREDLFVFANDLLEFCKRESEKK